MDLFDEPAGLALDEDRPQAAEPAVAPCYFTMTVEGDRVRPAKMSPSSDWLDLSVCRLGTDDPSAASAGQALLATAPTRLRSAQRRGRQIPCF